jgi:hypothetical protein
MNNTIVATCGACVIAAFTLSAQTPSQPPQPPSTPGSPGATQPARQMDDKKTVTLTGCLKTQQPATDAGAKPPAGEATGGGAGRASRFVLTDVVGGEGASSEKSYSLMADPSVKLDGHLNHKVALTGTVSAKGHDTPAPGASTKPSTPPPASKAGDMAGMKMPMLHVQSLKMVAATCP